MTFKCIGPYASAAFILALAGCGGAEPQGAAPDYSFRAFAQSYRATPVGGAASAPAAAANGAELTPAQASETLQLSRDWAVAAMDGGSAAYLSSSMALPALHFARQGAVAAAAHGTTLAQLQQAVTLPSDGRVQAALEQGLDRSFSALANWPFVPAFLAAVVADGYPGTWSSLALTPLTAVQLATDSRTRAVISDGIQARWVWPQAAAARGIYESTSGTLDVSMVRVQGPMLQHTGSDYTATGLALQGGSWLIKITPNMHSPAWLGSALKQALSDVATAIAAQPASAALAGDMLLPLTRWEGPMANGDLLGMAQAFDPVNADLRGLDQGGAYLKTSSVSGSLVVGVDGISLDAAQTTSFIFSPLNIYAGGSSSSGGTQSVLINPGIQFGGATWPACPPGALPVLPFHLAVMRATGSITVLARQAVFTGSRCQ